MKNKLLLILVIISTIIFSCDVEDFFEQPSIEVIGYTLNELPGEYTNLIIDVEVINNDSKEAYITDVEYTVTIEDFECEKEQYDVNQKIMNDVPLVLSLPLTMKTKDAVKMLTMLDSGQELDYSVKGVFHVDEPIANLFDLPIDINGTASVDVGFDDFYEQPEVTVINMDYTYAINTLTTYRFDFDVDCNILNVDNRDVVIDEVEYVVYIEGVKSETHYYSDSYNTNLAIAGNDQLSLFLPVTINLGITNGAALVTSVSDGIADYVIEGTFHAIEVDGVSSDFSLPLYITGSIPITYIN